MQLLDFFISSAHAEVANAAPAQTAGNFSFMFMMIVVFIFIYFTVIRPQTKRAKEQQMLLSGLTKGDEVITAGGLLGKISKISDQYLQLTIANAVEITVQKSAIVSVLPKGTLKSIE